MSEQLTLTIDGEQVQVDAGTTGLQHFANDKDVVVMHVDATWPANWKPEPLSPA